jgi:ABC-type polysaccharide/polyol phosphate transport system ATPase subunit
MAGAVIHVDDVSKRYRLGEWTYSTLVESLLSSFRRAPAQDFVWALRDVTLTIDEGEAVGIIGRNGAGKTTLLKILARITHPTRGVARVRGRVGALLEVGTGFHPELTGRENVFLNGAILGMSRADIRRRFEDIVAFAGVERFLDTPLKRYSSGMYLRLAFAVAAHLDPEIVVVDEVLAVGDVEFQQRCLGKMSELGGEGRTILFVSHDLGAIGQLCDRTIWIEQGRVEADGPTVEVLDRYLRSAARSMAEASFPDSPGSAVQLLSATLVGEGTEPADVLRRDEALEVRFRFRLRERIPGLDLAVVVLDARGLRVIDDAWSDTRRPDEDATGPGEYEAVLSVPPILPAGRYVVAIWFGRGLEEFAYHEALRVELWPGVDEPERSVRRNRIVQPPLHWSVRARAQDPVHERS